MEAAEAVQVIG